MFKGTYFFIAVVSDYKRTMVGYTVGLNLSFSDSVKTGQKLYKQLWLPLLMVGRILRFYLISNKCPSNTFEIYFNI